MTTRRFSLLTDPMILTLVSALALAWAWPVAGAGAQTAREVSNVGVFVLFLLNGMRIPRREIAAGLANWRYVLPLTVWVFGAMAGLGLGFQWLANGLLPPLVALGFLYLGVLPSTVQSATSYTTLAGGNIALAVVGAALLNIIGVVVSAPLFALLGGGAAAAIGGDVIIRIGLILLLPFAIGQAVQGWTAPWVNARKARIVWLDRAVIGLSVYVAGSGAMAQGIIGMFSASDWAVLLGLVLALLALATWSTWAISVSLRLPRADRIAFLFGGSQKSIAIGAPMAAILFAPDVAGFVIAPLLVYHLAQLVLAAPMATQLARG
ncbi:MAG: bile acid:sodium symporter [Porphyrobacter sp.]|jgi:sodium/bile acid cotransporter 7|nr:bile acid:sodium symporter [Porphyrobacter sp.]